MAGDASFWSAVKEYIPNIGSIDNDPRFSTFLNGIDPASGRTRRDLGEGLIRSNNVRAFVELVRDFQASRGDSSQSRPQTQSIPRTPVDADVASPKAYEKAALDLVRNKPAGAERDRALQDLHKRFQQALRAGKVMGV